MNAEASTLRVVIVLPLPLSIEPDDREQAGVERARVLRIALLEAGYNVVAALPGDAFLQSRWVPPLGARDPPPPARIRLRWNVEHG